jgi:4-hydroxy-tetrahydrodipicolinate reductase
VIRVGVVGATGRMGREVCRAVDAGPDLELAAAISRPHAGERVADVLGLDAPVSFEGSLDALLEAGVEVSVDFTSGGYAPEHIAWGIEHGVHVVVGTTGFDLDPAWGEQDRVGIVVAPNFAIGAVLMQRCAEEAVRYLPDAEIIELHHADKPDAPSGTAIATARRLAAVREGTGARPAASSGDERVPGARGADVAGVRVHSVRLPGLVAHQEVILGGPGERLTIRHDSTDRASFMPGVLAAIRAVASRPGLTVGLEPILWPR